MAGVSRATVSRVINGSPKVSPEVVAVVEKAIAELNYVPNRAARSLAARATMAVALVVPEDAHRFFGDPYFADVVQGISDRLDDSDYVLNLQLAHPSSPSDKTRRYLLGGNVDGAIVVSHHSGDHFLAALGQSLPVVFGGRPLGEIANPADYYVDVDNRLGAERATAHLIATGRRAIATITGPADMPASVDREQGWRDALAAAGLADSRIVRGDFTEAGGIRGALTLVEEHPDVDAIFVASDLMASGALLALSERGLRVPDDVRDRRLRQQPLCHPRRHRSHDDRPTGPAHGRRHGRQAAAPARRRGRRPPDPPRHPPRAARLGLSLPVPPRTRVPTTAHRDNLFADVRVLMGTAR